MQIFIEHQNGEKRSPLDIDLNETVEFLKYQLFSLTSIPPGSQQIIGLPAGVNLQDSMLLRQLGLTAGQRLIVKTRLTATVPAGSPVVSSSASSGGRPLVSPPPTRAWGPLTPPVLTDDSDRAARALTLQSCCSRSFFATESLSQPSAFTTDDRPICMACATTCHPPQGVKPRLSKKPMVCQCGEGAGECLYASRAKVAKDLLKGAVAEEAREAMAQVCAFTIDAQLAKGQQQFQARIGAHIRAMLEYEDPSWQRAALEKIPVQLLRERAETARREKKTECGERDELMNQLLSWFKHEFFQWINAPPCSTCNTGTQGIGAAGPTPEEAPYRPGVVEIYKCASGHITRFPRYNHALKLLETKRGRCGEWAQAFTLCARAMGFEVRSAVDWTDHIWTEYYSEDEKRWIHADPCENRRDAPLLYEAGWNKKLTYIISFSFDSIVDVTQRYTKKWSEVEDRRSLVSEEWLSMYIAGLNAIKLASLPVPRREELQRRAVVEQAEFERNRKEEEEVKRSKEEAALAEQRIKEEEKQGRTTGSVEWRVARGELGATEIAVQRALHPESIGQASSSSSSSVPPKPSSSSSTSAAAAAAAACPPAGKELCPTNPPIGQLQGLALNSTSPAPTATAPPPVQTEAEKVAAAKARTAALFKSYLIQLNTGCGSANCPTQKCKSNPNFATPITAAEIGKLALEMTKTGAAQLCTNLPK